MKVEFLLLFTGCRKVLGTMPDPSKISNSSHSWERGPNPIFYVTKTLPILSTPSPLFANFVQLSLPPFTAPLQLSPPPLLLSPQPPTPLLFLLSCFFGWMGDQGVLLNDIMDLLMPSLRYDLRCVLCNKVSNLLRSDTCVFLLVLWFDITQTHSTHRPVDWHTHINIYLHQLLCAHSSYLYDI